jgi:hypothetical protein
MQSLGNFLRAAAAARLKIRICGHPLGENIHNRSHGPNGECGVMGKGNAIASVIG